MKRVMRKQDRKEDKEREKVGSGKRNSQGYLFRDLVYFNKKTFHFPEVDVNLKPHLSLSPSFLFVLSLPFTTCKTTWKMPMT